MSAEADRWPVAAGLRLSLTTLTVLPLRAGRVDRRTAALAMVWAPAVGLALGAVLAATAWGLPGWAWPDCRVRPCWWRWRRC